MNGFGRNNVFLCAIRSCVFFLIVSVIVFNPMAVSAGGTPVNQIKIPILLYHDVITSGTCDSGTVTADKFHEDMQALADGNYTPVFFSDLIDYIEKDKPLPRRPVVITFDDGYKDNFDNAFPILKEFNFKATIFIIGWDVGRTLNKDGITPITPHFSWEEAREMHDSGLIDIQSHGYDMHNRENGTFSIDVKPDETIDDYSKRIEKDVKASVDDIERELGIVSNVFSYPSGKYNNYSEQVLKSMGFKVTLTINQDAAKIGQGSSLYLLNRLIIEQETDIIKLIRSYCGNVRMLPPQYELVSPWYV